MNKQIKFGIILQYLQMGLNILISLIYTPIMIKILGQSEYGIYNLSSSIISYLSLLSLGFGASYIRYYSKYKKDNDEEGVKKLNALYLLVFAIMGAIAFIAGVILSSNVHIFFNETYSLNDLHIAKVLMMFLAINLTISFPASVFVSYITSQEKFIFQKIVNMGKTILSPALSIALLYMGYGSIGMVLVTTVVSLIIDILNIYYCVSKLNMRFKFKNLNFMLLKDIAAFSIFIAINQVIDQINWQTDKIILGKMINGGAVAIYAVASTINTMYINFSTAISSVFAPKINRIVATNSDDSEKKLNDIFFFVGRLQFMVIMLILTGFIIFGKKFISMWVGSEYKMAYFVTLLLIIPVSIPLIQNVGVEIQRAKNKHQFRSVAYLIMAILNIFISVLLCKFYGIIGVSLGTTISLLLSNGFVMNVYYHKKLNIDIFGFWKEIMKTSRGLIIPAVFGLLLYNLQYKNVLTYFLCIGVYSLVYIVSILVFSTTSYEKKAIKGMLVRNSKC